MTNVLNGSSLVWRQRSFGFTLCYLCGLPPLGIATGDIYRGVVPFIAIQLMIVVILIFFSQLALYLPANSFGR